MFFQNSMLIMHKSLQLNGMIKALHTDLLRGMFPCVSYLTTFPCVSYLI